MNNENIKLSIISAIDQYSREITAIGDEILQNPETGFFEENTSRIVRDFFDKENISYQYPLAVTGIKATIKGAHPGPNVCIIGEMDSVKCVGHPYADASGRAHACGHNAQIAAMIGAALGIKKSGIADNMHGSITFFAVPAEEFIELEARKELKNQGKISFFGGKQQLIYEGAFDDVDMAMMIHAQPNEPAGKMYVQGYNLGFVAKNITIHGRAAHGSTPQYGTNALNAAALTILGIHSNRETFTEEDRIRIHPIITKGGDIVNSVPDEVCIETYVRGASPEAIKKGVQALERSVSGASAMIGATFDIETIPGYLPLKENPELSEVFEKNTEYILGKDKTVYGKEITGSTDTGDLSMIMPVIQPSIGGFCGALHSREFEITDKETAYISSAKILALTAADLLTDEATKAKNIISSFKPTLSKQEYINYLEAK